MKAKRHQKIKNILAVSSLALADRQTARQTRIFQRIPLINNQSMGAFIIALTTFKTKLLAAFLAPSPAE
jgi:hypothetical protein